MKKENMRFSPTESMYSSSLGIVVIAHNKINAVRNPNAISAVIIVTKIQKLF